MAELSVVKDDEEETPEEHQRRDEIAAVAIGMADAVRALAGQLMEALEALPDGREKSMAITKLDETVFWANSAFVGSFSKQHAHGIK